MNEKLVLDPNALARVEAAVQAAQKGEPTSVAPFNPDEYEIQEDMAHLYARAKWEVVDGKGVLVAPATDYMSVERPWSGRGYYPEDHKLAGQARGLADLITQIENGPDAWRLHSVHANGAGQGVAFFRRIQKLILATPPKAHAIEGPLPVDATAARAAEWEASNDAAVTS